MYLDLDVNKLPKLAFDHNEIIQMGLERLRNKIDWEPVGFNLLPKNFTLAELRELYEVIKGEELDPSNFRRWVTSKEKDFIEPTTHIRKGAVGPQPTLYRFKERKKR